MNKIKLLTMLAVMVVGAWAVSTQVAADSGDTYSVQLWADADGDGALGTSGDVLVDSTSTDDGDFTLNVPPGFGGPGGVVINLPPGFGGPGGVVGNIATDDGPLSSHSVALWADADDDDVVNSSSDTLSSTAQTDSNGDYTLNVPPGFGGPGGAVINLPPGFGGPGGVVGSVSATSDN